jgi:SAM-dependent methyltransferase
VSNIENQNIEFYGKVYQSKGKLIDEIKKRASYDQLSKSRRNLRLLNKHAKFNPGERIKALDYGCGYGALLDMFPWRPAELYGVDIVSTILSRLESKKWGRNRSFIALRPEDIGYGSYDNSMNVVCASHVIEHVPDDQGLFNELVKLVLPAGLLLINIPVNEVIDDPNHAHKYQPDSICFRHPELELLEVETGDRITAFLLTQQFGRPCGRLKYFILKCIRGVLAVLPLELVETLEHGLPEKYRDSQMLIIWRKLSD